jgi:transposase
MSKYSFEFKLSVVEEYLSGRNGYRQISLQRGVGHGHLREWIGAYKANGVAGLKKKFNYYTAETKLLVLKHMWDNKLSHRETIAVFDIRSRDCLRRWENSYRSGGIEALEPRPKGRRKKMPETGSKLPAAPDEDKRSREELLADLKYLQMENAYLKKLRALVEAEQAQKKRK